MNLRKIAILAPGLIGGSVALAVSRAFPQATLAVWTRRQESLPLLQKVIPQAEASTDLSLAAHADLVLLAAPPSALGSLVRSLLPHLSPTCLVTDVSSFRSSVEKEITPLLQGKARWIGSHPMAGSEDSGLASARADLFQKAPVILTPSATTPQDVIRDATFFWQSLGARVQTMTAQAHDAQIARISHLPHAVAAALVLAAGSSSLSLAGSGYRDASRIAAGSPQLWTEILLGNRHEILTALHDFQSACTTLTTALQKDDAPALLKYLTEAAQIRRTLPSA